MGSKNRKNDCEKTEKFCIQNRRLKFVKIYICMSKKDGKDVPKKHEIQNKQETRHYGNCISFNTYRWSYIYWMW